MATGTFFFDSSGLADYLQGYPNSSIEYGDDYMFALTYHSGKELIDLIEYIFNYYGDYGEVYNHMCWIFDRSADIGPDEDGDEFDGFIQEADDYLDRKQNDN